MKHWTKVCWVVTSLSEIMFAFTTISPHSLLFVGVDLHPSSYAAEGFEVPHEHLQPVDGPHQVGCAPRARPLLHHHVFHDRLHPRQQVVAHPPDRALEEDREALHRRQMRQLLADLVRWHDDVVQELVVDAFMKLVTRCRQRGDVGCRWRRVRITEDIGDAGLGMIRSRRRVVHGVIVK